MNILAETETADTWASRTSHDSEGISEVGILAWGLERFGIGCAVIVGREKSVALGAGPGPVGYAIHLVRSVPVNVLLAALAELQGRKGARAVVMTGQRTSQYREELQVEGESQVVGFRREFRRGEERGRECLVGVAWKLTGDCEATAGNCWRTVRAVMRRGGKVKNVSAMGWREPGGYFVGPRARERRVYGFFKRVFDVTFSLAVPLATLPICVAVAAMIKAYDRGPVFFRHRREGLHGRPFGCLKFRTMVRHAEKLQAEMRKGNEVDGPQFKIAYDPRVTPIGHFLRRTHIDELPQFINVLMGQMSVVGPRPSPFEENQICPGWREARLSVKPGITGLWQVSRSRERGAADFQEWILYDTQYVERRGFWLDVKIILLTIKELFGKGQ